MPHIIDTTDPNYEAYKKMFHPNGSGAHNGAYYYSKEIVKNIIPNVETWRPWDTLGMKFLRSTDHAIVFLHHNLNHDRVYGWLSRYKDLVYVCSTKQTYDWAVKRPNGRAVFLPLSIDVEYVSQFKVKKTKEACYAGNLWGFKKPDIKKYVPEGADFPPKNLPRDELLRFVAPYKICYAVGRSAMEASALHCKVKNCDSRYEGIEWAVLDNAAAAKLLQKALDQLGDPPHKPDNYSDLDPELFPTLRRRSHRGL